MEVVLGVDTVGHRKPLEEIAEEETEPVHLEAKRTSSKSQMTTKIFSLLTRA